MRPQYGINIIAACRQVGRIRAFARLEKQPDRRREIASVVRPSADGPVNAPAKRCAAMARVANPYGGIVTQEQPYHLCITLKGRPV